MGFERRIFARTEVEVQGKLQWGVKRRLGGVKTRAVPMQTIDLSVDGTRVLVDSDVDLPTGSSVLIIFRDESSPARVRRVLSNPDDSQSKMLCLQLEYPPHNFRRMIDQWLEANKGARKFDESSWLGGGVIEDLWADPPAA
ncbi:MAG: hypothetical protein ACI81L_002097 [Verrucomicrobiales bacterium]|jgi:hypothetical protein